ncbi:MAG: hypothetical protein K2P27_06460, partial [Lachnospiraceae bacterium]|nr:hypothetical protein [Lachnospiraceae bacterium]
MADESEFGNLFLSSVCSILRYLPNLSDTAYCTVFVWAKSSTNYSTRLMESNFQTHSGKRIVIRREEEQWEE